MLLSIWDIQYIIEKTPDGMVVKATLMETPRKGAYLMEYRTATPGLRGRWSASYKTKVIHAASPVRALCRARRRIRRGTYLDP
jgi:hypothetical protein